MSKKLLKHEVAKKITKDHIKKMVSLLKHKALGGDVDAMIFLLSHLPEKEQQPPLEALPRPPEKKEKHKDNGKHKDNHRPSLQAPAPKGIVEMERDSIIRSLMSTGPKTKGEIQKMTSLSLDVLEKVLSHPDLVLDQVSLKYSPSQAVFAKLKED